MNRQFRPASRLSNALSAVAAVISSLVILAGVAGLAEHYSGATQMAASPVTQPARA
ncbi:MAG: hypothetical protein ACM3ZD_06135 [Betaproteobacteria bacterium]